MSSLQDVLLDYHAQIDRARDRIRMFEADVLAVHDTSPPFKDWTPEAIALERRIIANLEGGIEILKGKLDAPRP